MAWEGLKTGLASIFGKDDPQWKDKGKGHKLGEGAPKAKAGEVKPQTTVRRTAVQPPTPPQPLIPVAERTSRASNPSTTTGSPRGMPPVSVGRRASGSDAVQSAVLDRVVMANTPTGAEMAGLGTHLSLCRRPEGESREGSPLLTGMEGLLNTPTAAERNMGLGVSRPNKDQDFHLQQCLCMIVSQDEAAAQVSLALLYKLLRNVLSNPTQPKYRSVRMGNPAIQSGIVNMRGAMEFLDALGFTTIFQPVNQPAVSPGAAQQPGPEGTQQGGAGATDGHLKLRPARSISQQEDRPSSPLSAARSISQRPLGHMTEEEGQPGHSYMLDNQQGQADAALEGYLVLPEDASLHPLTVGVHELITVMGALGMDLADTPTQSPPVAISSSSTNISLRSDVSSPTQPAASAGVASAASLGSPTTTTTQGGSSSKLAAGKPQAQQQQLEAPIDRQTQVVLPVAPDTQVPDWVFERTGADLKAEVAALARKRAAGEVLATRAWRERAAAAGSGAAAAPQAVTLRVRFPEGICLQGSFGVREPVTRIFEWVTESLRYMEISYELITPSRKPLPSTGLIRDQPDLRGPAVLNFRTLGGDLQAFSHVCHLSDAMLRQTYAE